MFLYGLNNTLIEVRIILYGFIFSSAFSEIEGVFLILYFLIPLHLIESLEFDKISSQGINPGESWEALVC